MTIMNRIIRTSILGLYYCILIVGVLQTQGKSKQELVSYNKVCNYIDGYCYQGFSTKSSYQEAWYQCHSRGMHLFMPKTCQQMDFVRDNILGNKEHVTLWFGLKANMTDDTWWWQDNEQLVRTDFNAWQIGRPSDIFDSNTVTEQSCGVIESLQWTHKQCDKQREYICQDFVKGCTIDSPYLYGNSCYHLTTGHYEPSSSLCGNGSLAMPKDKLTNQYLSSLNLGLENMWIGLWKPKDCSMFKWFDGDTVSYSDFVDSFDETSFSNNSNIYAYMTPSGQWDAVNELDIFNASYLCEYPLIKDCGSLLIDNGYPIIENTTEGVSHLVKCLTGYTSNMTTVTCDVTGSWVPEPICYVGSNYVCACEVDEESLQLGELIRNLTIDKSRLSSVKRTQSTADDNRLSAMLIGIGGGFFILFFILFFIILDVVQCM